MDKISIFNAKNYNIQFKTLLKNFINSYTKNYIKEEYLELFIDFIFFYYGVHKGKNLPGNKFENIQFIELSKNQKTLFFIIEVLYPYLIKKFKLVKVNKLVNFTNFLFFLIFLKSGKFINLQDFIIKIRYEVIDKNRSRFLNSEYLNRNLAWQYISSFLLLIIPILQNIKLFKNIKKVFLLSTYIGPLWVNFNDNEKECQLCYKNNIYNPHLMEQCGCLFCYYCIKSYLKNKKLGNCPKCNIKDQKIIPLIK